MVPDADTVLLRYGDVSTKSDRVQRKMTGRLVENVRALLADRDIDGTVEEHHARPRIRTTDPEAACGAATDAMGVVSASPALVVDSERRAIENALSRLARETYTEGTFAIRARRATTATPFDSEDVGRFGGNAVGEAVDFAPAVDLDDPDCELFVEVRDGETFVFAEKRAGPGGLPLGTQGRLVALVSGGIDSPVAAYEMMRRGSPVVPVYLELGPYGGPDHEARAIETMRTLNALAPNADTRGFRVSAGPDLEYLADAMDRGRMLSFRRYMLRVGETLAREVGAEGVVTGEALGQKSSQTARNLRVSAAATDYPVHRPLLNWDKQDIVERAREIGTFSDSKVPAGCERFAPPNPETSGRLPALERVEPDDVLERAERAARSADRIEL